MVHASCVPTLARPGQYRLLGERFLGVPKSVHAGYPPGSQLMTIALCAVLGESNELAAIVYWPSAWSRRGFCIASNQGQPVTSPRSERIRRVKQFETIRPPTCKNPIAPMVHYHRTIHQPATQDCFLEFPTVRKLNSPIQINSLDGFRFRHHVHFTIMLKHERIRQMVSLP